MKSSKTIRRTLFNLGRLHRHGVPTVEIKSSHGSVSFKCRSDDYDCPNGTHIVDIGHGDVIKLCDECFVKYQNGPGDD